MQKVIDAANEAHANFNEFLTFCKRLKAASGKVFVNDVEVVKFSEIFFKKIKVDGGDLDKRQSFCLGMLNFMSGSSFKSDGKPHKFCQHLADEVKGLSDDEAKRLMIVDFINRESEVDEEFNRIPRVMASKYRCDMPEVDLSL